MVEFILSEEHVSVREQAHDFAASKANPVAFDQGNRNAPAPRT